MAKRIITINRMFGSNGRLIGKTLAEKLDMGFYDKELIDMAAKKKKPASGCSLLTVNSSLRTTSPSFP